MASRSFTMPPLPVPNSHHNRCKPYRFPNYSYSNSPRANLPTKVQDKQQPTISESSQCIQQSEISSESKPRSPTIRSRLCQLCQEGQPEVARRLFDTISQPNTVLWNTIIIGFICNGMPSEALRFYVRMKKCPNTRSDSYTYSSVLKACAETQQLKIGKSVHCQILRSHANPSRIVSNSLLNMYSNCLSPYFEIQEDKNESGPLKFPQSDVVQTLFDGLRKRNAVSWNTIIAWYVKTGRFVDALKQFKRMIFMGIKPTVVSFINVFPAAASIGDQKNCDVLYGLLLKMGSEYVSDLFAASSAIFMYSELGDMVSARQIFDLSKERNIEVWNTMISGYVQNDQPAEGLNLFLEVLDLDQIIPDSVTFLSALTAASQLQQLDFGLQLHAYVIKNLMSSNIVLSNALMALYSRCDFVEAAFTVFDKMLGRDLVSWNTIVSAFVQNGLDDEGLMLVYEMQKQGFTIDSITATALLSAASNLRNLEIGKQTHAYLYRHWIQFEGMDSYLIDMYMKTGLIDAAEKLFEKNCVHDRDQVTWNAMISGYSQNGQIEQALIVFRQMLQQHQLPNAVTLASILPACSPVGGLGIGKQVHGFAVRHALDQNVFVGTALMDVYSKCGAISYAERVFTRLPETNSVTYTTMISGYGMHGLGEKALSLFQSMPLSGMKPDVVTLVAVLSACSYSGLVDEGLQIFETMEDKYMIARKPEHYCCVVDMLGRAGRITEAYELINELGDEANVVGLWGSLLGACRIHKKFELGKVVSDRLLEMEKGNSMAGYHVLLSNLYAEERKWDNVERVRKVMREKGLRKEVGRSWIEINGVVNCFTSRDQKHPQSDAVYAKLDELAMEIKLAGYSPSLRSEYEE